MTAVFALATTLFQLAPGIFATVEAAIGAAERLSGLMKGDHVDPAALDALLADIKANSERIQREITE